MPDTHSPLRSAPRDWSEALSALPLDTPPAGGWNAVSARLDARRRSRWPLWAASAATLALALALPWRLERPAADVATAQAPAASSPSSAADPLEALYTESAQLEALLVFARDDRVSSGTAALVSEALDEQLSAIDLALMQPGLSRDEQLGLWQQRVEGLRAATGFESNRRWLAAQGGRYDAALVTLD